MFTRQFLVGVSTIAFAAGAGGMAHAQNTISSSGTGNFASCDNANVVGANTPSGNVCKITQTGNNDSAYALQATSGNSSEINQTGNSNIADHRQGANTLPGGAPFAAAPTEDPRTVTGNVATTNQNGTSNSSQVRQVGYTNDTLVNQSGISRIAAVAQNGGLAGVSGSGNTVRLTANGGYTGIDPNVARTSIAQGGNSNYATVTTSQPTSSSQAGNYVSVIQGSNVNFNTGARGGGAVAQSGDSNTATVTVQGSGSSATIDQRGAGTAVGTSDFLSGNSATISMNNGGSAGVAPSIAIIRQLSSDNRATNVVNDGGTLSATSINSSTITQSGTGGNSYESSKNSAFASLSQGSQMSSTITQTGRFNAADVTLTSGVDSAEAPNGTRVAGSPGGIGCAGIVGPNCNGGNNSTVTQTGNGSTAYVSIQAPRGTAGQGFGNYSLIQQTATAAYAAPTGVSEPAGTTGAGEPANINGSRGQYATVWQQGIYASSVIRQNDNGQSGKVYGSVTARPRAATFQAGQQMRSDITQTGDNYAEVTQGRLTSADRLGQVDLSQTDAGDLTPTQVFGGPVPTPVRGYNRSLITQYGISNRISATQNTIAGYQSLFQTIGSQADYMDSQQGTGNTINNAGGYAGANAAPVAVQSSAITTAGATSGSATRNLSATITQSGKNNGLRAYQDGTNNTLTIEQLGSGTAGVFGQGTGAQSTSFNGANNTAGNVIQVFQQSDGNRATARQTSTVTASSAADPNAVGSGNTGAGGDPFSFVGGARSAEIQIFQGGRSITLASGATTTAGGNAAFAEQRGKGQFARIEQNGSRNTAGILQDTGATNATAVISQDGDSNSYYIVQTAPGQYLNVSQTGNSNSVTNSAQRGAAGGSDGITPPPGFPTF